MVFEIIFFLSAIAFGSFVGCQAVRYRRNVENQDWDACFSFLQTKGVDSQVIEQLWEDFPDSHCRHPGNKRSQCIRCNEAVPWFRNIPVVTWCLQRGRSRCCGEPLAIDYLCCEVMVPFLALILIFSPVTLTQAVLLFMTFTALFVAALIDFHIQILPDHLTFIALACGLGASVFGFGFVSVEASFFGLLTGFLVFEGLRLGFRLLRGYEGLGYGDSKLIAALGAWFGVSAVPVLCALGSVSAIAYVLIASKGRAHVMLKDRVIPFGPFLIFGAFICLLTALYYPSAACQVTGVCL